MLINRQRRVSVALPPLRHFCDRVQHELGFARDSVTIQLVSDQVIAQLNETYRKKQGPTDVLSFPANGSRHSECADYVGDIAISPESARRNARRFSRQLPAELKILILHGLIHLAGYDHETDDGEMDRFERRMRKKFGIAGQ